MQRNNKAFTVIEALILIVILGILAAVIIPSCQAFNQASNAKQEQRLALTVEGSKYSSVTLLSELYPEHDINVSCPAAQLCYATLGYNENMSRIQLSCSIHKNKTVCTILEE